MSNSLWSYGLQHTSLPCPSLSQSLLRFMSIESVILSNHLILCFPLLLLPSIFPSIRVFSSDLFASSDQSVRVSTSASVITMNIQSWFPLGLTGLILQSKGLSRIFSSTTVKKPQFFGTQPSLWSNSHIHRLLLKKPWLWLYGPFITSTSFVCSSAVAGRNINNFRYADDTTLMAESEELKSLLMKVKEEN